MTKHSVPAECEGDSWMSELRAQSVPAPRADLSAAILANADRLRQQRVLRAAQPGLGELLRQLWSTIGGWRWLLPSAASGMALALIGLNLTPLVEPPTESVDVLSQAMLDDHYENFLP